MPYGSGKISVAIVDQKKPHHRIYILSLHHPAHLLKATTCGHFPIPLKCMWSHTVSPSSDEGSTHGTGEDMAGMSELDTDVPQVSSKQSMKSKQHCHKKACWTCPDMSSEAQSRLTSPESLRLTSTILTDGPVRTPDKALALH